MGEVLTAHKSREQYYAIDLLKFIMAFLVVAIHTGPLVYCNNPYVTQAFSAITSCAVPFFFLSTGFLLGKRISAAPDPVKQNEIVKAYLLKIIRMYIVWNIVYMPLALYAYWVSGDSIIHCALDYLCGFLFIGQHYNSWILWYLLSTIYALLMFLVCRRFGLERKSILIIGFLIFMARNLLRIDIDNNLYIMITKILSNHGRIFTGAFYIPLGMVLCDHECGKPKAFTAFAAGLAGIVLKNRGGVISDLLLAICVTGLFLYAVDLRLRPSTVYIKLRNMSTTVYFIHMYVWTAYYTIVYGEKTWGPDSFIVTSVVSVIIGLAVIYVRKYKPGARHSVS